MSHHFIPKKMPPFSYFMSVSESYLKKKVVLEKKRACQICHTVFLAGEDLLDFAEDMVILTSFCQTFKMQDFGEIFVFFFNLTDNIFWQQAKPRDIGRSARSLSEISKEPGQQLKMNFISNRP
jgi:hypothetical protein